MNERFENGLLKESSIEDTLKILEDELNELNDLEKKTSAESELKKINDGITNIKSKIEILKLYHYCPTVIKLKKLYHYCPAVICVAPDGLIGTSVAIKGNERFFSHVDGFIHAAEEARIDLRKNDETKEKMDDRLKNIQVFDLGGLISSYNAVAYQIFPEFLIAYLPETLTLRQKEVASYCLKEIEPIIKSSLADVNYKGYTLAYVQSGKNYESDELTFESLNKILEQSVNNSRVLTK